MALVEGLLESVKNYPGIDITWVDAQTDIQLTGIIERGMKFLDGKAGATLDYSLEEMPRELLFEFCKYTRNGVLNEFMINYSPFLQDLRAGNGGAYGETTTV